MTSIAESLGVSKSLVSRWRSGGKNPGPDAQRRLEKFYGVPAEAWSRAPLSSSTTAPEASKAPPAARAYLAPSPAPAVASEGEAYALLIDSQLARLLSIQDDSGLTTAEAVRVADSIAKLISEKGKDAKRIEALRADLEREYEHLAVEESPFVRRYRDQIIDALRPYPDALRAVVEAISA